MNTGMWVLAAGLWLGNGAGMAADGRLDFEVWVDGARRGSAWIAHSAGGSRYASGLDLQVVHARMPTWVRERLHIRRDARGGWQHIHARSSAGRETRRLRVRRQGERLLWRADGTTRELRWAPQLVLEDQWLAQAANAARGTGSGSMLQTFDPWSAQSINWQLRQDPDTGEVWAQPTGDQPAQTLRFAADGRLLQRVLWRGGLRLEWRACVAPCTTTPVLPLDLLDRQSVRAPYAIPDAARAGPIRYRLQLPVDWPAPLPSSVEQQVVVDADGTQRVTVCPACTGVDPAPSAAELQRWRSPDAWIQSDDARIRRFARQAGGRRTPALTRMRRLQTLVGEHLRVIDPQGYHSALETLASQRGDCTESALLLAAAARASGLPARIVAGLVYSQRYSGRRDVYTPHYWVQVWIEQRWHSFDAGIGEFDATHLALVVGDGDPQSTQDVLSRSGEVRILRMARVRSADPRTAAHGQDAAE